MSDGYLRERARWFTDEAVYASELNGSLHGALDRHGTTVADGRLTSIDDIPLDDYWTLSIVRENDASSDILNRQGQPLARPVELVFWTRGHMQDDHLDYTEQSGGAAVPIVVGSNGAFDRATGQLLDVGDLERLAWDFEEVVWPYLDRLTDGD